MQETKRVDGESRLSEYNSPTYCDNTQGEHGKVFFYTAENEPEKEKLLELLDVQVVRAEVDKPADEEEKIRYYKEFYRESIAEIIGRVNTQLK